MRHPPPARPPLHRLLPALLAFVAAALVLGQALALLHGVQHAGPGRMGPGTHLAADEALLQAADADASRLSLQAAGQDASQLSFQAAGQDASRLSSPAAGQGGFQHAFQAAGPGSHAASLAAADPASSPAAAHADAHATAASWLDALFASHAKPGDCRLVDALLQGGPCTAAPAVAAAAFAQHLVLLAALPTRPGEPLPFDARGPPPLR